MRFTVGLTQCGAGVFSSVHTSGVRSLSFNIANANTGPISRDSSYPMPAAWNGTMSDQTREIRIRLVLLDELGLFRASLGRFLASEAGFEVAGECGTPTEALEVLQRSTVDVVLLDFEIGTEHSNDFISAALKAGYPGRFLIVAGALDVRKSAIALKLGASGIFLKSEAPDRLVQAINLVANGGVWVDQKVIRLLADQLIDRYSQLGSEGLGKPLDDRARNVILGILGGLSNRKIGDNMGISESAVKNVIQQLFSKANVRTRSQLVRVALEGSLGFARDLIENRPSEATGAPPEPRGPRKAAATPPTVRQSHE